MLFVHTQADPLGHNFLVTLVDGAPRMQCKKIVHLKGDRIHVGEKECVPRLRRNVDSSVTKVCVSTISCGVALRQGKESSQAGKLQLKSNTGVTNHGLTST